MPHATAPLPRLLLVGMLFAPAALPAGAPAAADPAAGGPPARRATYHDRHREALAYHTAGLVGAYRAGGRRDAKWDAAAESFLAAAARRQAADAVPEFYRPFDAPTPAALVRLGLAATDAGCGDPTVRGLLAVAHADAGRPDLAFPLLKAAVPDLEAAAQPDLRVAIALGRLADLTNDRDEQARLRARSRDRLLAACCEQPRPADRRHLLVETWARLPTRDLQKQFVEALARKGDAADPWVRDNLVGRLHNKLAWDSRGTGRAAAVTPEGWRGFYANLPIARDAWVRAWTLDPTIPNPAGDLVGAARAGGPRLGEDPAVWWRRALEAQVDFLDAYNQFTYTLTPRWDGSYEEMLALADACIAHPRYDTLVPWEYVDAVRHMGVDAKQPWFALDRPNVYANVLAVCDGYAKALGDGDPRAAYFRTARAAAAWRARQAADCRKALDRLTAAGGRPDPRAFEYFGAADGAQAVAEVYARTGAHHDAIAAAERDLAGGRAAAAADRLAAVRVDLPADHPSRPFVDRLFAGADADVRFAAGDFAPMQLGPALHNWRPTEGQWAADADGAITGRSAPANRPKMLVWKGDAVGRGLGTAFELTGVVEYPPEADPGRFATAGVAIYAKAISERGFVMLDLRKQKAGFLFGPTETQRVTETPVRSGSAFRVRCAADVLTLEVDGNPVGEPYPLPDRFREAFEVGLGGVDGSVVRFRDLRVRKLPAGPAGGPD